MEFESVDTYLKNMYGADAYLKLDDTNKVKIVFSALESLKLVAPEDKLTPRLAAIQVLYVLEGEDHGYAMLKRQGVTSYANKGVSASFDDSSGDVAPSILVILKPRGAKVGRLR